MSVNVPSSHPAIGGPTPPSNLQSQIPITLYSKLHLEAILADPDKWRQIDHNETFMIRT